MTTFGWREKPSIRQWLIAEPYRFEFIQAVRLLEQFPLSTPDGSKSPVPLALGPDPNKEAVHLRSHVGFDFSPSELRAILPSHDSHKPPELVVNVMQTHGAALWLILLLERGVLAYTS